MALNRLGRSRPKAFPDWCDTGKQIHGGTRHSMPPGGGVVWTVKKGAALPHYDHIEMTGFFVSGIISYGVDELGLLKMNRHIVYPGLRMIPNDTRGSLTHNFPETAANIIRVNGEKISKEYPVDIHIKGILKINSLTDSGISLCRTLFPAREEKNFIERIDISNVSRQKLDIEVTDPKYCRKTRAAESLESCYYLEVLLQGELKKRYLHQGETLTVYCVYNGRKENETPRVNAVLEEKKRLGFLDSIEKELVLHTPSEIINRSFKMTKIRFSESIFQTKRGLMHAPGGGDYYAALWTNDQCEYTNPLFPFTGYGKGIKQSINAYQLFMNYMKEDFSKPLVSSIVAEGDSFWNGAGDRGDAAMFAYGALRFALAYASEKTARDLWPGIKWSIDYSLNKINREGVVESDSDELENRFESGNANLFTSCLLYDALYSMSYLVEELNIDGESSQFYREKAEKLALAIEHYFGGTVEGFETYEYYKGGQTLRSWICMPLVMGITNRAQGTIQALFSKRLWTENGLKTHGDNETFWDRSTLFALRGVFISGSPDTALEYLESYSKKRLLGEHVPYPVEAYPEGNQRHLAGESALYVRIVTEGIFGIRPTGFQSFNLKPQLPGTWPEISLKRIHICQTILDIQILREGSALNVLIRENGRIIIERIMEKNSTLSVDLSSKKR